MAATINCAIMHKQISRIPLQAFVKPLPGPVNVEQAEMRTWSSCRCAPPCAPFQPRRFLQAPTPFCHPFTHSPGYRVVRTTSVLPPRMTIAQTDSTHRLRTPTARYKYVQEAFLSLSSTPPTQQAISPTSPTSAFLHLATIMAPNTTKPQTPSSVPWTQPNGISATYALHCHCGAVRYEMTLSPPLYAEQTQDKEQCVAVDCNCSHCERHGSIAVHPLAKDVVFTRGLEVSLYQPGRGAQVFVR